MAEAGHRLSMALVHHPVRGKDGGVACTSVTPMSVHDMARLARTFGLARFYVVTPLRSQQRLLERIERHWREGAGAEHNPSRREALEVVRVVDSLNDAIADLAAHHGTPPKLVATGAAGYHRNVGYDVLRGYIRANEHPYLLLFGTAWGLDRETMDECDHILDPIDGLSGYNHLPVRSAAAIIVDRIVGR